MHGRRGQNETKRNNAFANRLTVLHPETSVKLDVEPNDTWDKRLRKRGRGEPVKKSRVSFYKMLGILLKYTSGYF